LQAEVDPLANGMAFLRQAISLYSFLSVFAGRNLEHLGFVWLSSRCLKAARRFGANSLSKSVLKKIPSQTSTNSSLKFFKT
jgi:hypothetical protein